MVAPAYADHSDSGDAGARDRFVHRPRREDSAETVLAIEEERRGRLLEHDAVAARLDAAFPDSLDVDR